MSNRPSAAGTPLHDGKSRVIAAVLDSWRAALPNADVTSVSMSITIGRLAVLINRRADELARHFGFGYGEMEVLFYLLSAGEPYEMRPSDLMRGTFVTSGAITGRVDRLAKLGLVRRIASPIDRRQRVVRLTRVGEKLARRLQTKVAFESALSVALGGWPTGRRATLDNDLRLLLERVERTAEAPARTQPRRTSARAHIV